MATIPAMIPDAAAGQDQIQALGQGLHQANNALPALPQVPAVPAPAAVTTRLTNFAQFFGDESKDPCHRRYERS
jgi:hypothetical protein